MATVTGIQPEFTEAILADHACYRMKHRIYPGAIPCNGCFVRGRLYLDIDDATLECLDAFEDVLYQRQLLVVRTLDAAVKAQVYIVADEYRKLLLPETWDIDQFTTRHLVRYLESCRRFYQGISRAGKTEGHLESPF